MARPDERRRRAWRFRLNDVSTLHVSTPPPATEKQVRRRGRWSLILGTLIAALAIAGVAFTADQLVADGDLLDGTFNTPGSNEPLAFGDVCPDGSYPSPSATNVKLAIKRNDTGAPNPEQDTYSNSSNVSLSVGTITDKTADGDGTLSANLTDSSIVLENNWATIADGTLSADRGDSTVTLTVPDTADPGSYTGKVQYVATGAGFVKSAGSIVAGTVERKHDVDVSWTVLSSGHASCASSNSAPVIDNLGAFSGVEGSAINLTGTAHDPDGDPLTYSWSVNTTGGDTGISCPVTDADNTDADASVTCNDDSNPPATFEVTFSVSDDHGHTTTQDTTLSVTNANPAFDAGMPAFAAAKVTCASNTVTLDFGFGDAGANDTHTATIDWGDGSPVENLDETATAAESRSHTYNSGGPYTAVVNVTDDDAGSTGDTNSTNSLIVEYNLSPLLQPVNYTRDGQVPSVFKYGSSVPLRVEITDCNGAHPTNLDVRVKWSKINGDPPAEGQYEASATYNPDGGNQMRYNDPYYQFVWSTKLINDPTCTVRIQVNIMNGTTMLQNTYSDIGLRK